MWKLNFSIRALIATVGATLKCLEPGILNEFYCCGLKYTNYFIIFSQLFIYGDAYIVLSGLIWTLSTKLHSQSQKKRVPQQIHVVASLHEQKKVSYFTIIIWGLKNVTLEKSMQLRYMLFVHGIAFWILSRLLFFIFPRHF